MNSDDSETSKKLFKQYYPQVSLNKKCSGGVFIAKSGDKKELILKSAKFGFGDRSAQTIEKLKNEKYNLEYLKSLSFVPRVLDEFYEASDYFLVESKLPGIDINTYRASVVESAFGDTKTNVYEKVRKVIQNFLSNLSRIHDLDIQIGDISSTNVLVDKVTDQVSFVDFNDSEIVIRNFNGHTRSLNKTVGFFNSGIYFLNQFEQDKQQAGYLIMALFSRANSFLAIDRTGKKTIEFFRKFAAAEKIPAIFVKIIEQLVISPNVNLKSIQKELRDAAITEIYDNAENHQTSSLTELINGLRRSIRIDSVNHSYKSTRSRLTKSDFLVNDNTIHHIINSPSYSSLMFRLIRGDSNAVEIIRDAGVQSSLIGNLNLVHWHLERLGKGTLDEDLLPLHTIIPVLYCSLFIDQKKHVEVQSLVVESFRSIVEKYAVKKDGKLIFRMSPHSRYCSPYLLNGVAGMLVVALNIREVFGINENDWLIGKLSAQLAKMRYPQNVTFSHGLSGIIWALLLTKRTMKTDIYDQDIQQACKDVAAYLIRLDDGLYVVNEAFNQLSFSFQHGNRGVIFALKVAQDCFGKI
jgi:serine/threonine protein kinase